MYGTHRENFRKSIYLEARGDSQMMWKCNTYQAKSIVRDMDVTSNPSVLSGSYRNRQNYVCSREVAFNLEIDSSNGAPGDVHGSQAPRIFLRNR